MTVHLKYPFRLTSNGADVLEQDSIEEITQCVQILVSTNIGSRVEVPGYGIPDPVFDANPQLQASIIRTQVAEWEPRAQVALSSSPDELDELMRNIRLAVQAEDVQRAPDGEARRN